MREPGTLTGMTGRDWSVVLQVLDTAESSPWESGYDVREFLEAIHYFTVHSITWRALPAIMTNGKALMALAVDIGYEGLV